MDIMVNEQLRQDLLAMQAEDRSVRQELVDSGELGGPYVPRMEDVHRKNAERLREVLELFGWPAVDIAGQDGAEAAWLIAQHAIGEPDFQRRVLALLRKCVAENRVPARHAAYLEDRIATHEGRPQRYGTQWVQDPTDGRYRPWSLADADQVDDLRKQVGLSPMQPIPDMGPALPAEKREEIEQENRWWQQWFICRGWRE
jgi:hypothetical protein